MSNKESTIKEIKNLLEVAQKNVLDQINTETSFFSRVFSSNTEALKQIQSCIAKSLNQLENLNEGDSAVVAKLQANMSEKDQEIKSLANQSKEQDEQIALLEEKLALAHKQNEKLQAAQNETKEVSTTTVAEPAAAKLDTSPLEEKIENLEAIKADLEERFKASKDELSEAQGIAVELNNRLKKLKVEIVTQ